MKKLVIFSLIAVLVTGAVFAQDVSIGGFFRAGADVVGGITDDVKGRPPQDQMVAGITGFRGRLNFSATNDEETFGGFLRVQADGLRYPRNTDAIGAFFDSNIDDLDAYLKAGGFTSTATKPDWLPAAVTNNDEAETYLAGLKDARADAIGKYSSAFDLGHLFDLRLAHVWWQPIELLKFQAGIFDDLYLDEIVNEFGGDAEQTGVHNVGVLGIDEIIYGKPKSAFGQFFDAAGAILSLYPVEGLAINVGIPYGVRGDYWTWDAEQVYKAFLAQVSYDINDIGRASLAFRGIMGPHKGGSIKWKPDGMSGLITAMLGSTNDTLEGTDHDDNDYGTLYAAFYLTAVENLSLNFGLSFTLPYTETWEWESSTVSNNSMSREVTTQEPIKIALGATFDLDPLSIAARIGVSLGGYDETKTTLGSFADTQYQGLSGDKPELDKKTNGDTIFGIQLLPSYDLDILKVFLNLGLTIVAAGDNDGDEPDPQVGFWINPYIEKTMGGGSFFAGIDLFSDGKIASTGSDGKYKYADAILKWRIPVGMKFTF